MTGPEQAAAETAVAVEPAPTVPMLPPAATVRPYAVCNGYGEHLYSFAQWDVAHAWAHRHVHDPRVILPLEIEDRAQRLTTRITRDRCDLITWTVFTTDPCCGPRTARVPPYLPDRPRPATRYPQPPAAPTPPR